MTESLVVPPVRCRYVDFCESPHLQLPLPFFSLIFFSVSSVIESRESEFGKKFLFDNDPETCWSSESVFLPIDLLSSFIDPLLFLTMATPPLSNLTFTIALLMLQGLPQYIIIDFADKPVIIQKIKLVFQGGFAAKVSTYSSFFPLISYFLMS